jgi:tight adherence protein B
MRLEFKDLLYALAAGLRAGYAMENAWLSAEKDIAMLYPEEDFFRDQIHRVGLQLELNVPIETAIREMAENCKLEEIYSFAEVLNTAKRSGGNLVRMMDKTSTILAEKIEVEQEIQTMLSGKKMEQRIMCGMPFFLLLYLRLTNAEYIKGLYHNIAGIIVVTICIAGTIVAAVLGERILGIEV